jgi:hypothetical protein
MYRVIILRSNGQLNTELYGNLPLAYQACLPNNNADWHIMLYNAVADRLNNGNTLISVSYNFPANAHEARWIEFLPNVGIFTPFPALLMPQAGVNFHHA